MKAKPLLSTLLLLAVYCQAQQQRSGLVIANTTLFDGERFIHNATVYMQAGRITDVTTGTPLRKSAGEVIDGRGKTLLPGLINAHVHVVNEKERLQEAAQAGVLTAFELFNPFKDSMRLYNDSAQYATLFTAGVCATAKGGHGTQYGVPIPTVDSPPDARPFVRARKAEGVDFIKLILEHGADGKRPTLDSATLQAVVSEAGKTGLKTVVHVSLWKDALMSFRAGADGLAHYWYRDSLLLSDAHVAQLSKRRFFIIPTLLVKAAFMEANKERTKGWLPMEAAAKEIYRLHKAGVPILAGTDPPNAGINFGTDLYKELRYFLKGGFSVEEALRTATSAPADAFGLRDRGRIRKGLRADLVLVEGDLSASLDGLGHIYGVWKAGVRLR